LNKLKIKEVEKFLNYTLIKAEILNNTDGDQQLLDALNSSAIELRCNATCVNELASLATDLAT
jgi:hypothetical protein